MLVDDNDPLEEVAYPEELPVTREQPGVDATTLQVQQTYKVGVIPLSPQKTEHTVLHHPSEKSLTGLIIELEKPVEKIHVRNKPK